MPDPQSYPQVRDLRPRCSCLPSEPNMRLREYVSGAGARYECRWCGRERWLEASCPGFDVRGRAFFNPDAPFASLVLLADAS